MIDANDEVHNFDLERTTIDIKHRRYHNFLAGEVIEENMDFNHWDYTEVGGQNELGISNTSKFA